MATVPWRHLDSVRTFTEQLARGMCNTLPFLFVAFAASYSVWLSLSLCICNVYCYLGQHQWHQSTYKTFQRKSYHHHHHRFIFAVAFRFFIARFKLIWELILFLFCSLRFYLFYFFFLRIYCWAYFMNSFIDQILLVHWWFFPFLRVFFFWKYIHKLYFKFESLCKRYLFWQDFKLCWACVPLGLYLQWAFQFFCCCCFFLLLRLVH